MTYCKSMVTSAVVYALHTCKVTLVTLYLVSHAYQSDREEHHAFLNAQHLAA